MAQIALNYSAAQINAAIAKINSLVTIIEGNIVQLYDGTTAIYPRTKAEAVFFDGDKNKTLTSFKSEVEKVLTEVESFPFAQKDYEGELSHLLVQGYWTDQMTIHNDSNYRTIKYLLSGDYYLEIINSGGNNVPFDYRAYDEDGVATRLNSSKLDVSQHYLVGVLFPISNELNSYKIKITQKRATKEELNTETTNRTNADTVIKNAMVKSCVSTDEAFNDVVKELYFDRWVDITKISTISLKRNGIAGNYIVWEMYITDINGKSSWASFGKNAETDDVNVAKIGAQEGHFLYDKEVSVYAVIDWNKVPNNDGVGEETKHFSVRDKMLSTINNAKYFPKISECLVNHKYTHSPVANSVIKELYFENLTKNGYPISNYEFSRFFSLQRIDRNKPLDDGSDKRVWSLVFYVKNPDVDTSIPGVDADNHFFSSVNVSPENDIVIKMPMSTTLKYPNSEGVLTDYIFEATTYAVVDWSKLKNGEDTTIIAPLLSGCLDVRNSPIISAYIGNTIKWSPSFNMNDYKTQGIYYITGERLQSESDNLPIMNASPGHTISGQLTVLDASLSKTEQCITQYLKLTNRLGSEGKEYIRTYNKYSNGSEGWSVWRELQSTTFLGQVTKQQLDKVIDNGIYTGITADAELMPAGSTFTLIVINNYAVNSAVGMPAQARQVSQTFIYLPLADVSTGAIKTQNGQMLSRTGVGGEVINWLTLDNSNDKVYVTSGDGHFNIDTDIYNKVIVAYGGPDVVYLDFIATKDKIIEIVIERFTAYNPIISVNGKEIKGDAVPREIGVCTLAISLLTSKVIISYRNGTEYNI